jgi:hypothetical protein
MALDVCRNFASRHVPLGNDCFEMPNVDGNAISKFVLAVLWRGSISSRPECKDIRLGPYENRIRDVLFGSCALSELSEFELLVLRLRESATFQSRFIYTFPTSDRSTGVNRWGFVAGGFRFVCKINNARGPAFPKNIWNAQWLTGQIGCLECSLTSKKRLSAEALFFRSMLTWPDDRRNSRASPMCSPFTPTARSPRPTRPWRRSQTRGRSPRRPASRPIDA